MMRLYLQFSMPLSEPVDLITSGGRLREYHHFQQRLSQHQLLAGKVRAREHRRNIWRLLKKDAIERVEQGGGPPRAMVTRDHVV
jgi:hypothetical protein